MDTRQLRRAGSHDDRRSSRDPAMPKPSDLINFNSPNLSITIELGPYLDALHESMAGTANA